MAYKKPKGEGFMQKKGIIRLFSVFAICFFIIAYNIADILLCLENYGYVCSRIFEL